MIYLAHIVVMVAIYVVLAASLDLLVGQTGILSLAHAAFYGIGAYAVAVLTLRLGASFLTAFLAAMIVSAALSVLLSLPSLRLREDYFVMATLGFQLIASNVLGNWIDLTRGPLGIAGVPGPRILGWVVTSQWGFVALTLLVAGSAWTVAACISASPFGRVLRAIREDELVAEALGKDTIGSKIKVVAISAMLAAAAGGLYAYYVTYIDPSAFTITESILVLAMVIIGGAGSRLGSILGALLLVVTPELLRFFGFPDSIAANTRQFLFGSVLVLVIMIRPKGLVGRYGFGR